MDLAELLAGVAAGSPPPADCGITVVPQPPGPVAGVLSFNAHHVVAADVEEAWVRALLPDDDLVAPMAPPFVGALSERLGVRPSSLDVVLVAAGTGVGVPWDEVPVDGSHPRAARALRYRRDVRAWSTEDGAGLLLVGRGLAGRWEAAFEVDEAARGRGLGRRLAAAAPALVPEGEALWVQVAPGNVSSLRCVLAAGGYRPVGGELLFATG